MPLGFSLVLPSILTPQSLGKFSQQLGICGYNWVFVGIIGYLTLSRQPFLVKGLKKRYDD